MRITVLLSVATLPALALIKTAHAGAAPAIRLTAPTSALDVGTPDAVHVGAPAAAAPGAAASPLPTVTTPLNDSNGLGAGVAAPAAPCALSDSGACADDLAGGGAAAEGNTARLKATPISAALGAEITAADGSPLDLAATWDDELYEEINHSLLEYKVLIFKNQTALAPETQLAMAQKWGPVPGHPLGSRQDDAISADVPVVVLENTKGRPQEARNDMWHSDVSCVDMPAAVNLLYAADYGLLPGFGDTLFANMERAWESLTPELQENLKEKIAFFSTHRFENDSPLEPLKVSTGTYHPAVRSHPETCRDSLYISPTFFDHFKDMPANESAALHTLLSAVATKPENTYRHRWTTGDFIIFDNRNTMHYAVFDYEPGQTRTMHSARAVEQQRPFSKHHPPAEDNAAAQSCVAKLQRDA